MSEMNRDLFRQNIRKLMDDKKLKQKDLSEITGMPQSNISKALKDGSDKFFTIDHIYALSEYFNKSIDALFGRDQHNEYSEKDICSLIVSVIDKKQATFVDYEREEKHACDDPYEQDVWTENFKYSALIFPVVYDIGPLDQYNEFDLDDLNTEFMAGAHEMYNNQRINEFIKKYKKLNDMYIHHDMDEEDYRHLIEKYLDELS